MTSVDNQVKAKAEKAISVGKVGTRAADQKLEMAVESLLKKELGDHAKGLEVENVGGTVSVRGTVPDDARLKIARDAVKSVPGVKEGFIVRPPRGRPRHEGSSSGGSAG